jgi:HupE/UreJ protein
MSKRIGSALALLLLVGATSALAHSPIMGIGGVLGGILHALLIPEHGLSLLALGLVLGQQEQSARRSGILIYLVAVTCGLVATAFAIGETLAADALLTATGILDHRFHETDHLPKEALPSKDRMPNGRSI